jgi:hypothetical protein
MKVIPTIVLMHRYLHRYVGIHFVTKVPELREWTLIWDDQVKGVKAKAGRKNWLPKCIGGIRDNVNKGGGLAYHDEYTRYLPQNE